MYFNKVIVFLVSVAAFLQPVIAQTQVTQAEKIFNKSIKVFSKKNIRFIVDSTITYPDGYKQQRSFLIANRELGDDNSSILIRFLQPADIKCTAVLVNKKYDSYKRYAFFPALNRTRVIPESDKQKEVFGIGISYDELSHPEGQFEMSSNTTGEKAGMYKISLTEENKKSVYFIDQESYELNEIQVIGQSGLQKKIIIQTIQDYQGKRLITRWQVQDMVKKRTIQYFIRPESIVDSPDRNLFRKNRLSRCIT